MFSFKRLLYVFAFGWCVAATTAQARKIEVRLADYGISPNEATDSLLTVRLASVLEELRDRVGESDKIVLKLERGTYHLHAAHAPMYELYISNHDQGSPKRVGIYIEGWHDLTLDGKGAEIICHGRMLPIAFRQTKRCVAKNLNIDFDDPQIVQVQVVKNSSAEGITFEVAPWVNYRVASNGRLETFGEGWAMQQDVGMAFERDTRHIVYRTSDISVNTQNVRELGGRQLLAPQWKDDRLVPGTVVALRSYERPAPGLFLDECTDTEVKNVVVHYAEGMGLLAQRCTNVSLKGFDVRLRGADDLRYFTTQADATHFSQCRGKIISRGGLYESMMDDAVNIHGIYLRVTERMDDNTLRCTYGHEQAWGFSWGDVGDTVSFVRADAMEELVQRNVITAIRPDGQNSVAGCKGFVVTLRDKLPEELTGGNLYGMENLTWTPEAEFSHNIVRNNRARGALFSSPRRTVCEDNLFDHTSGAAILLCGDCNGWFESGAVRDLVVRRNTFVNALTNMFQFTNAVVSIYPEIPRLEAQKHCFHGGKPASIRIEDNSFDTFDAPLLYAKSVCGLTFRNNQVRRNTEYAPFHWNHDAVKLERCEEAAVEPAKEVGGKR